MWTESAGDSQGNRCGFQSLSQDSTHVDLRDIAAYLGIEFSFNPSVGIRPMWTTCGANEAGSISRFQSLSRDSTHVDVVALSDSAILPGFQSLSRDSTHVDIAARMICSRS